MCFSFISSKAWYRNDKPGSENRDPHVESTASSISSRVEEDPSVLANTERSTE